MYDRQRTWARRMPPIRFKSDWDVKIIPPYCGAAARFVVEKGGLKVSVYADVDGSLGWFGNAEHSSPYWEIYPLRGDTWRCALDDTESLVKHIEQSFKEREENV